MAHDRPLALFRRVLRLLDGIERLRTLVELYVEQHNTQMPHAAFSGQTPDEMYFGTPPNLPAQLGAARDLARAARLAANRAMSAHPASRSW
jgi:putative transposase